MRTAAVKFAHVLQQVWGMAYKNTTTLPGNSPFMHYFTQNEALWPNAIPGKLFLIFLCQLDLVCLQEHSESF